MEARIKARLTLAAVAVAAIGLMALAISGLRRPEAPAGGAPAVAERADRAPPVDLPRRAGAGGREGAPPGPLPQEVLDAIAGRPVTPKRFPGDPEVAMTLPDGGLGALGAGAGGEVDGAGAGAGDASEGEREDAPFVSPARRDRALEAERRARWRERQVKRDDLRADLLTRALGLDAARRAAVAAAFAEAREGRIALFDSLDPQQPDEVALGAGLDAIGARLTADLNAVLGPTGVATYEQMERDGAFVLPEEMKVPPPR